MYVGASMWCVLRWCLHVLLSFDTYVACLVSVDTSEMAKATTGMLRARQKKLVKKFAPGRADIPLVKKKSTQESNPQNIV